MRKVFLFTGFNNWGKTTMLADVFSILAFRHHRLHQFRNSGCSFLVIPKSNDDLGLRGYCEEYHKRIHKLTKQKIAPAYIASAFCPTKEKESRVKNGAKNFTSIDIIRELYSQDEVHMLLLRHKWCGHAELIPQEIQSFYANVPNLTIHPITSRNYATRLATVNQIISANLP